MVRIMMVIMVIADDDDEVQILQWNMLLYH